MGDDFDVRLAILNCFLAVFEDAVKRNTWEHLSVFLDSDLCSTAFDLWIEISPDTMNAFLYKIKDAHALLSNVR
jgi:hypothetical protein